MDKRALGLACIALGFVGCGNTLDGSSPEDPVDPVLSGDASKPLAKLTDDEKIEVCEAMSGRYEDPQAYGRGICILAHAQVSDDSQSCEAAIEECFTHFEFEPPSIEACLETLNLGNCDATVRDLSDCLADSRRIADEISELRSCEDVEREGASKAWFDNAPGCQRLLDRCPDPFHRHEIDDSELSGSPEDSPYFIEGSVDGQALELRPGSGYYVSEGFAGEHWTLGIGFGRAEAWLWGKSESKVGQGLLRMPLTKGAEDVSWLCLEEVEVEEGNETTTWKSSKLSTLPVCAEGERRPLELTFEFDSAVSGTLLGEAVAWTNTDYDCDQTCRFEFGAGDAPLSGRDVWILEIDTSFVVDVPAEFEHATLIHPRGARAVACGGGGVVFYDSAVGEFHIVVDALSPLSYCPGTPVDGELSGAL